MDKKKKLLLFAAVLLTLAGVLGLFTDGNSSAREGRARIAAPAEQQ